MSHRQPPRDWGLSIAAAAGVSSALIWVAVTFDRGLMSELVKATVVGGMVFVLIIVGAGMIRRR